MIQPSTATLEPRKTPIQARSAASVDAILEATVQVLIEVGKERLTTTRVALRAGVSVGTLYQYFPNKRSLLQACLRRHLTAVTSEVEAVCKRQHGKPLKEMATALISAFLAAKMRDVKTSAALYSVSGDVDGVAISQQLGGHSTRAIVAMLGSAHQRLTTDPQLIASMLQGSMVGISRRLLESDAPERDIAAQQRELILMACAYLDVSSAAPRKLSEDASGSS